jgi:hypothetical protein
LCPQVQLLLQAEATFKFHLALIALQLLLKAALLVRDKQGLVALVARLETRARPETTE